MTGFDEAGTALVQQLAQSSRGPRRDGVFALWLVVRVAEGTITGIGTDRSRRRRVQALEKRLSSLTVAPAFRRSLAAALPGLRDGRPEAATAALSQLVGPVTDTLGAEAAGALQTVVRSALDRVAAGGRQG
jgi:hypothetical protein